MKKITIAPKPMTKKTKKAFDGAVQKLDSLYKTALDDADDFSEIVKIMNHFGKAMFEIKEMAGAFKNEKVH